MGYFLYLKNEHSYAMELNFYTFYYLLPPLLSRFSRVRLCNPIDGSPPGPPHPWDSPGKNTGVGCHFLLPIRKSASEVTQSCPTLSDPMDYSLPGSSVHGIFQARVLEWGAIAFSVYYLSYMFYHSNRMAMSFIALEILFAVSLASH